MPERKAYPTTPSLIPKAVSSKKPDAVWQAWQRIVEQYSKRNLTVAGDKLPAISGIASKIRKATHSDYLAGLWKGNLASDLLWHTTPLVPNGAINYALETWRAPTFSWASLDSPITYTPLDEEERETFVSTIVFLAASIVPTGLNPLGTISTGVMTLRGPTISAILCAEQNNKVWEYSLLIKGTSTIRITHDCALTDATIKIEGSTKETSVRRAQSGDVLHQFKAPVLCLSVARYDNVVAGLVLTSSEQDSQAWERIGTFAAGSEALQETKVVEIRLV